jgi:hypothetical protein
MTSAGFLHALKVVRAGGQSRGLPVAVRDEATRAFERWLPWSRQPAVQGLGIARRSVEGRRTADLALKVYVDRKLPLGTVARPIPREIDAPGLDHPIPIDVEQIGRVRLQSHTYQRRPAYGGLSVSHEQGPAGTLGCLLRRVGRPNEIYLLGNAHVLARSGFAKPGDRILQPAIAFGGTDEDTIATLTDWTRFDTGPAAENRCDAAIALVAEGAVSARIGDLGIPTGMSTDLFEGDLVRLCGAMSDQQTARVLDLHFAPTLRYRRPNGVPFDLRFVDQVMCERYSQEGDSGAAILDNAGRLVGLHFAGSESRSFFSRIDHVLNNWGDLEVVTAEPWPPATSPPSAGPPLLAGAFRPPVGSPAGALDLLARTLWGEARSEGTEAMEAIAAVAVNRALTLQPDQATTLEDVCRDPLQFACWDADSPIAAMLPMIPAANTAFRTAQRIASNALAGTLVDPVRGATRYHRLSEAPAWARGKTPCARVGIFIFYNSVA